MSYYYCTIYMTLSLLVLMLSIIFCNKNMLKNKRKVFIIIYFLLGIATFCEWLSICMNGVAREDIITLHKFVKFLELSITPTFFVIYAQMIFSISKKSKTVFDIFPIILLVVHTIFEFLSMNYGFVFLVDDAGYFHYGDFYNLFLLTFALTSIYFFQKLFLFSKYYQNKNGIIILLIVSFIIIGMSIQFAYPNLKTTWLTIGMASVFVYIYYNEITMYIDYLTQLLNQRSYKLYLEHISFPVTILLFDVDCFKSINDTFSHHFGDTILSMFGSIIKEVYGNHGKCYRIGGDEFCVILTDYNSAEELQHRFIEKIEEARKLEPRFPYISMGSAHFEPGYQDISDVIKIADQDLYYWKNKRKQTRNLTNPKNPEK